MPDFYSAFDDTAGVPYSAPFLFFISSFIITSYDVGQGFVLNSKAGCYIITSVMNDMASAMGGLKEKVNRFIVFWGDENGSILCKGVGAVHGTEKEDFSACSGCVYSHVLIDCI